MIRKKEVTPNAKKEMVIYKKKEVIRIRIEKKKQNMKDNKRNWHIFALTGRFDVILPSKICLLNKHKSLFSPLFSKTKKVNISKRRILQNEE
jgi:hypothetical protein